jgi:16S rRNA (guanine527-N7)-methyltransferase
MPLEKLGAGFSPLLERVLRHFDVPLTLEGRSRFLEQAATLLDRAVEWNARIDLTSVSEPEELVDLLFADAAAVVGAGGVEPGSRWVDVGSGIGAPGLPLALLAPGVDVTLVEPRTKRVSFLRTVIGTLGLGGVRVERSRSDVLAAESFDVAISRATMPPPEWLAEGARLSRRRVWVLLARAEPPSRAGWLIGPDLSFVWPLTKKERRAAAYDREGPDQHSSEIEK